MIAELVRAATWENFFFHRCAWLAGKACGEGLPPAAADAEGARGAEAPVVVSSSCSWSGRQGLEWAEGSHGPSLAGVGASGGAVGCGPA